MKERKPSGNSILRVVFVALSFLLQIVWLLALTVKLNAYSTALSAMTTVLSLLVVLRLNSKHTNTAMKVPWIMLILVLPVMGLSLYLLVEILGDPGVGKRLRAVREDMKDEIPQNADAALEHLEQADLPSANQARYLWNCTRWPVYENTAVTFYAEAKDAFEAMKADLEKAETFIFMEYFIVEDSTCFWEIEDILVRKQAQGVEVRFLYDDIGSVGKVNMMFAKRLCEEGIACRPFNPALPLLNIFLNHRDHRKITVIDGKVGFTGGYNLAEEYFDRKHPYGQWKDTGLRLEGEAVRSLTAAFLELWSVQAHHTENYGQYLDIVHTVPAKGFVQPFADNPLGQERAAEEVYLNLVSQSNRQLYFMTPYLIITDEMNRALRLAAKRGVDVRIITPGIPDKKLVYAVTRSYYAALAEQGVRIYEYTPGFCHAKQCLCDGRIATVGTSNLDYRSLYHHFENNVVLYGCDAIADIAADFENTFPQCREVTESYRSGRGAVLRTWQYILRLFAPLM